ncbi:MAG: hypothetical protein RLZZ574_1394, partial [Cyanobacteriota bacterium]
FGKKMAQTVNPSQNLRLFLALEIASRAIAQFNLSTVYHCFIAFKL